MAANGYFYSNVVLISLILASLFIIPSASSEETFTLSRSFKEVPASILSSAAVRSRADAAVNFTVSLKMRNFAELQTRVARGEGISAQVMTALYQPLQADFAALAAWFVAQGLTVDQSDGTHVTLSVTGTTTQIARALKTQFAEVIVDGKNYQSVTVAPSLPASFADVVLSIGGLQPHIQPHSHASAVKMAAVASRQNSQFLSPQQIRTLYGAESSTLHGEGQIIAIVMDASPYANDLNAFWSQANVNQTLSNVSVVNVLGGNPNQNPASGDYLEACMDVEWASAMATGAQIRVYVVPSLAYVDSAYRAILNDAASLPGLRQVSLSYGLGEQNGAVSQFQADEQLFAQMAAAGITVFASSGDGGSSPSANGHDHSGAVQAESPASCTSVMGVGGTSQNYNFSTNTLTSEPVWYDCGGGSSIVFPRPSWQANLAFPSNTGRLVPDVTANADPYTGGLLIANGSNYYAGGTSWSSPMWAGFCAQINQARAQAGLAPVGLLAAKLYPLMNTPAFRDITVGSNGPSGTYNASSGFDLCSGLGVPNVANIITALTTGDAATARPNLTAYWPADFSEQIVVSTAAGTYSSASRLTSADALFVNCAVINSGGTALDAGFAVGIYVDTTLVKTLTVPAGLAANGSIAFRDIAIGTLKAGVHSIQIKADINNAIAESDETDNVWSKAFSISPAGGNHAPVLGSVGATPNPANVGEAISFSASATDADLQDTPTYAWVFGDGSTGTDATGAHSYAVPGTYTATVTVSDGKGGSDTGTVSIVVNPAIPAIATKGTFLLNYKTGADGLDIKLSTSDFVGGAQDGQAICVEVGGHIVDTGIFYKQKATGNFGKFTFNAKAGTIEYVSRNTSIQDLVAPYGAINDNISTSVQIPFSMCTNGKKYLDTVSLQYSAKLGKTGKGH